MSTRDLPLHNVRVLDLTRILAGPFCTRILADMGAEIIKVESPRGDHSRHSPPFVQGQSIHLLAWNRSRKSITLNLFTKAGKGLFKELLHCSDVVVENFRPGVMASIGLGYESLREVKPDIILSSITGYGQDGPYAYYPAHNTVLLSFSGVMDLTGFPDKPPVRSAGAMGDCTAGLAAALGTVAALYQRHFTGRGQHVDVSMLDCLISYLSYEVTLYLLTGVMPTREGNRLADKILHDVFMTQDGWVYIQADLDNQWRHLATLMGRTDLLEDPRFETPTSRAQHREEIDQIVRGWVASRSRQEVFKTLVEAGVPCAPTNTIADVVQDPQVKARRLIEEVDHPVLGRTPMVGSMLKFPQGPKEEITAPPLLGEHNEEVYCRLLGYSSKDLASFKEQGIL